MKRFFAFLAAAALCACAAAPGAETPGAGTPAAQEGSDMSDSHIPAGCPLLISFGSYAMGIDRGTLRRVEALLAADPAVTAVIRSPWGREGEVTLCAAVRSDADRDRLFAAVAALFPRRPHGPLSIRTNDGREFRADNAT
jgi:hypothetical protein